MADLKNSIEHTKDSVDLDGTELYGQDGQTIADIRDLGPKEINELLGGIKKEPFAEGSN